MKQISTKLKKRIEGVLTRAGKFFEQEQAQSPYVLHFSRLDEAFLRHHLDRWPKFHALASRGNASYPVFGDFLVDLFFALYLYDPQWRPSHEIQRTHRANLSLLVQASMLRVFHEVRAHSVLNRLNTMLGVVVIAEMMLEHLPEEAQGSAQAAQEAADGAEGQDIIDNIIAVAQAAANAGDEDVANDALNTAEQKLDALEGQPEATVNEDDARRAMRGGLSEALSEMQEFEQVVKTWGTDPGTLQNLPPDEVFDMYERMRGIPHFKKFTDMIGRQRLDALAATQQLYAREPHELVDVTTGRTFADLLPSERMSFADETLETAFWLRYLQEGTLTWAYAGREEVGKGPIIICSDVSGSTWGPPERWGKAFALAAIDLARRQQRDLAIIFFDCDVREDGIFVLPKAQASLQKKVEIASYYTGGGTNFQPPLTVALNAIQDYEGEWKEADIVLLTDGCYPTPETYVQQYRAATEARGIRTHGVLLQGNPQMLEMIKPLCDQIVSLQSLQESPRAIFSKLAS